MRKIQRDTNSGKLKVNSWQGKPKKILMRKLLKAFKVAIKRQLKKKYQKQETCQRIHGAETWHKDRRITQGEKFMNYLYQCFYTKT